ncbi:hypothetical protein [Microcoleus sp. CAWBG640]|uniref:hypothetical protein n=1 Tax=Microcoleus sp. CAWBG640 TaxID=2841653 RepID=UPI00312BA9F4
MTDKQQQPTEEIKPPANSVCEAFQMQLKTAISAAETATIALNAIGVAGTEIGAAGGGFGSNDTVASPNGLSDCCGLRYGCARTN